MITARISNYSYQKTWEEITYPFPNLNSCTVEVWEWISNFIPHSTESVSIYTCWDLSQFMLIKGVSGVDGQHQAEGDHNLNRW